MIKLSVLICSTHTRSATFLPKMMESIFGQYNALPEPQQQQVEILILVDNKKMMLGEKRNEMVNMAQGEFIVFVDDDDRLEPDYLQTLLNATQFDTDAIVFDVSVKLNNGSAKICSYSKNYEQDENVMVAGEVSWYKRLPNHICCVRRELALQAPFPSIIYGEDSGYSKLLKPLLTTETKIYKVLYHYDFNSETTETQQHLNRPKRKPWGRRR